MPGYRLNESASLPNGRLTIFRPPEAGVLYAIGLDFAYGLEGGDADAGIILDEYGEQCAVLHGRWGNTQFYDHLTPLLEWYEPFVVGERQVGLEVLRKLWDDGRWMYFQRDEEHRSRPQRDKIGHHASHVDGVMMALRRALRVRNDREQPIEPAIIIHDAETLAELSAYQFLPRSGTSLDGLHDHEVKMGAPSGMHDDLVKALGYAWMGLMELPKFEKPAPKLPVGSIGHALGHEAVLNPPPQPRSALAAGPKHPPSNSLPIR
jgi:hypothetical protein